MQLTIVAAAIFCFVLNTQTVAAKEVKLLASPAESTLKFDLYRNYLMVVKGSAGSLKGLTFVVDTGASPSILDPRVAQKLRLQSSPATIHVVSGSVHAGAAIAPSLALGPIARADVPVFIEDLSFYGDALPRIDGVIGMDVLGQSAFVIDYGAGRIFFGVQTGFPNSIPLQSVQGLAFVDAEVDKVQVRMLVDTGAASLLLFARDAGRPAKELKVSAKPGTPKNIGECVRRQVSLQSLRLGQTEFSQTPADVVQDAGHDFDGIISPVALGMRRVAIDLARGELAFSR